MLGSALVLVLGLSKEMEEVLGHPVAQVIGNTISAIKITGETTTINQPGCFFHPGLTFDEISIAWEGEQKTRAFRNLKMRG
jgi:translation initiation factor 6 (eIF-6)